MTSSDESVCSSCFSPWHNHWLRVKDKTCISLPLLPCIHQTHFSSQTPYYQDHNDQRFFMDGARNAFLALTCYIGLLFTSLNFCQRAFLEMCKFNTHLYTSKCMNQGMFVTRDVIFTTCPTSNTGPR